jgi:Zn-dependent protease
MPIARQGSFRLGRLAGVDLYLHWSWFVVAAIEIQLRSGRYTSVFWSILEYLSLFLIVLLHEFGHAMACRQTGGVANSFMLWPLGGVAYVNPPQRPGAMLWSLAAGPLVNVALLPFFVAAYRIADHLGWQQTRPDLYQLSLGVMVIDLVLLVFNLLPIYPLDGGQILRSLLWFVLGRAKSLAVATVIGFIGAAALVIYSLVSRSMWNLAISAYMLMNCWSGFKGARVMLRQEKLPRRQEFACPGCLMAPPLGPHWKCAHCSQVFDTFATSSVCPHCGAQYGRTMCLHCHQQYPMSAWVAGQHTTSRAAFGGPQG